MLPPTLPQNNFYTYAPCCIYINSLMFHKHHQPFINPTSTATEACTVHPLPTLFRLLGLELFKKVNLFLL